VVCFSASAAALVFRSDNSAAPLLGKNNIARLSPGPAPR
jgi:hypothetical protein